MIRRFALQGFARVVVGAMAALLIVVPAIATASPVYNVASLLAVNDAGDLAEDSRIDLPPSEYHDDEGDEPEETSPDAAMVIPLEELAVLLPTLQAFHGYYQKIKPRILAQEAHYIEAQEAIEKQAKALSEAEIAKLKLTPALQGAVMQARKKLEAMREAGHAEMQKIDRHRDIFDLACYEAASQADETLCAEMHDEMQLYEREASVLSAMFEVVEERWQKLQAFMVR